jgi:hypothetical protein
MASIIFGGNLKSVARPRPKRFELLLQFNSLGVSQQVEATVIDARIILPH